VTPHISTSALRTAVSLLLLPIAAAAEPLALSQAPPAGTRMPAPNVIISVDNASAGDALPALRRALGRAVANERLPAGSVRLGWQDQSACAHLPGAPDTRPRCSEAGDLRLLDDAHRARFQAWAAD